MATDFETPAYGIPNRFKTPEQRHKERLARYKDSPKPSKAYDLPYYMDVPVAIGLSVASSFMSGFAGDAKSLDYMFDSDITKDTENSLREIAESISRYKPTGVAESAEKKFITDEGTLGEAWGDIYAYADLAGSGLGSIAAMIIGGGLLKMVAKGGIKAMITKGVRKKADDISTKNKDITRIDAEKQAREQLEASAEKYDNLLGMGAYGTAEMAIVSGSVGYSIEQEVMRAPAELLNQSERFREIYFNLVDNTKFNPDQAHNAARTQLSREAGIQGAKIVAIPTLLTGAVLGRYIDQAISGRMTKSTLANFAILEGVEIPTEAVQGGTEQYVQNKVYKDLIDKTRNVWAGVPDSALREALGVAFGVAPLALVGAQAATARQVGEDGGPGPGITDGKGWDDLDDGQQLALVDLAAQIDETATEQAMERTEGDGPARIAALAEIIAKGNADQLEEAADDFIELDEQDVDDFLDETAGGPQVPGVDTLVDDEEIEPAPEPAPEGPDLIGIGQEIEEEVPPKDTGGPATPPAGAVKEPEIEPEPEPVDVGEPIDDAIYEVDFDTFREGKASGRFTPAESEAPAAYTARNVGILQESVDIEETKTMPRAELNSVGKALGIKTLSSRSTLEGRIDDINRFTQIPVDDYIQGAVNLLYPNPDRPGIPPDQVNWGELWDSMVAANEALKEPLTLKTDTETITGRFKDRTARTNLAAIIPRAEALQKTLADRANEFYDRQQHREAIEAAVEKGDFTLEDFEALPETDQKAYADIGRQLRAGAAPAPTPIPETPEVPEGTAGEGEGGTPPESPPVPPSPPPETEPPVEPPAPGPVEVPPETPPETPPQPPVETPPPTPVEVPAPEGTEPETPEGEEPAGDDATITEREAIIEALSKLEEGDRVKVYGNALSGDKKAMKPASILFRREDNGIYQFTKGNDVRQIREVDGDYYLTSVTGKRSRIITSIEPAKKYVKDTDEESENLISRPHEIWGKIPKNLDDADQLLKDIKAAVAHSAYVNGLNYASKTHGVKRMYKQVMRNVPQFLKWVGQHTGAEHGVVTPAEAILAIARNQPLTQYNDENTVNIQTIDELRGYVDAYVEMLGKIQEMVENVDNVKEFRNAIAYKELDVMDKLLALPDADYEYQYNQSLRGNKDYDEYIDPEENEETSLHTEYQMLFPKLNYPRIFKIYMEHITYEELSDEKLDPKVPRERRKLSELAAMREGMPDHRQGKNVTRQNLIDTFAFIDVVYGDWVSDTALEGTMSERQQYRNLVYDAFADLAYLTGLPNKVMGKDLYLSLGAIGQGKATGLAFFSPSYQKVDVTGEETDDNIRDLRLILDNNNVNYDMGENAKKLLVKVGKVLKQSDAVIEHIRVIQFTKEKGDGAFAHEWTHNLGNKLKYLESGVAETLQYKPSIFSLHKRVMKMIKQFIRENSDYYDEEELTDNLKRQLESMLDDPKEFMRATSFHKNAKFLDMVSGSKYWSTTWEMFARATEGYIFDAIQAEGDGAANPFLQGIEASEGYITPVNGYLATTYPEEEERAYFNDVLKSMFADIISTDDGGVEFKQGEEEADLKFGIQVEFERIRQDYIKNLDDMIEQARLDREQRLLSEEDEAEENLLEDLDDDQLEDLLRGEDKQGQDKGRPRPRPGGGRTGGRPGAGAGGQQGPEPDAPKPPKTPKEIVDDLGKAFGGELSPEDMQLIDDLLNGGEDNGVRFSMSMENFGDTRFSVADVQDRNPNLDPVLYEKIVRVGSRLYARFRDAGNRNLSDFGNLLTTNAGQLIEMYQPYFLQFLKDVRNGDINYRDYVDAPDKGADKTGEGADDGAGAAGADDRTGIPKPPDGEDNEGGGAGADTTGATEEAPAGEGGVGTTGLDITGTNAPPGLNAEELSEWIQEKLGLRSPSVEPLPSNAGIEAAQVSKTPIAAPNEGEQDVQVPTLMAENMENAVRYLSDIVGDLDEYVMEQLGYTNEEEFHDAYMSFQVEAVAAAIYQMGQRNRSVVIADQTGVGKGRQAGALIRWAIKQGLIPVFVTENPGLYTDMYYDMFDSYTRDVNPFITNEGIGIKDRNALETEENVKNPPLLHKVSVSKNREDMKAMEEDGTMPSNANAMFTTYSQMDRPGRRRNALMKLMENNKVILILDESHKAAKFTPPIRSQPNRVNRNEFFTAAIKASAGTTYLSATFAKNPDNLAFYFNTDLIDAMDGMRQLVDILANGGLQLQEVMSRALVRNGQMFRREISYKDIDIVTEFADPDSENAKRDRKNVDNLAEVMQSLVASNNTIYRELTDEYKNDPMGVATILRALNEISQKDFDRIADAVISGQEVKVNFTKVVNQIHNLTNQISVASKADLAVDKILEDIKDKDGKKPIIGLDKTNMAMLHEYIHREGKEVGDDMSDLDWPGLLKFWANKSFNVSIGLGPSPKEADRIRGSLQGADAGTIVADLISDDAREALNETKSLGYKLLSDIDLPLSPIDYIAQTSEARALKELGKTISIREITGRFSGDFGIDYTGDKPTLYRVKRFEKRDVIDAFNGEIKNKNGDKIDSTVDGLIINQSGSTGVSMHSSTKHGDRRIRHMTILEPAGDINVFQQMLGRIFRTGMGDTYPLYTVLASAIPSDIRRINVLRRKMQSLNAQTSSNREGATGVDVEDIFNSYGNDVVFEWIDKDAEFQEMFPNYREHRGSEEGFAYWATGKIALFNYEYQKRFYDEVYTEYAAVVEDAKANGTYTLEEKFYDWKAKYLEEWTIAEPRGDGKGFNDGSWLVKFRAEVDFKAMNATEVAEDVEAGKKVDISPDATKVQDINDKIEQQLQSVIDDITALKPAKDDDAYVNRVFDQYKHNLMNSYKSAAKELLTVIDPVSDARNFSIRQINANKEYLDENKQLVKDNLPAGTKTALLDLEIKINAAIKHATNKKYMEATLESLKIGKTYNIKIGEGDDAHSFVGTVLNYKRLNKSVDPYTMGDIEIDVAADRPGGTNSKGIIHRTLGQASNWDVDPVYELSYRTPDDMTSVYVKYHETLAITSKTTDEYVVLGNPLVAAGEIVATMPEYMQFSDEYGRRMFGIKMNKAAKDRGIEGMIAGRLEIPIEGGGTIITNYIKENTYSRLSREFGFRTRAGNVVITIDPDTNEKIRITFNKRDAGEKAKDPELKRLMDIALVQMHELENTIVMSVPISEAPQIINQVLMRSRLTVESSQKRLLSNYMNVDESVKAGDAKVSMVQPKDVKTYVFDYQGQRVVAHRGKYQTARSGEYDGFYMEGLGRYFNLNALTKLTFMKGKEGEHKGRPFIKLSDFERGNVFDGRERMTGLGKPIFDESITLDGTSFSVAADEGQKVDKQEARTAIEGLPFRLKRLVNVVQSESELPAEVRMKIRVRKINGKVKGVYHKGKIWIVSDALATPDQAMIVFLHEGVGHLGLRKLMGENLNELLDEVAKLYPDDMQELSKRYKVNIKTDKGRREIAEEVVAHIAERDDNPNLWQKIVALFRKIVRALRFNLALSDTDVRSILQSAKNSIMEGGFDVGDNIVQPTPLFSIKSSTADPTDERVEIGMIERIQSQPVDAVFRGLWHVVEATQLPRLVKASSAATLRTAMNFYDNHMGWAHPAMQHIAKGMIDQYGLSEEYKQTRASRETMKAEIIDEVRDIIEVMETLGVTDKDAKLIQEILTNEAPREEAWDAVTEPIRKRIEVLGQQAVNLELISQESYDRNKGMYLHRVYQKYEGNRSSLQKWADDISGRRKAKIIGHETKERGLSIFVPMARILEETGLVKEDLIVDGEGAIIYKNDQMSENGQKSLKTIYSLEPISGMKSDAFTVRFKNAGRVKLHRDWTKQERTDMGEIVDARYVLGKTFSLLANDLANGNFFSEIAQNPEWTMPQEEEEERKGEIMSGESALRYGGTVTGASWVRVPSTKINKSQAKVYGALSGRVIRSEIFQDLNQLNKMQTNSVWKSILTTFKLNKTARNPVVHFNNIMSNIVLMDMADVRFSDLYQAIKEMRAKGDMWKEAKMNNAFGVSFAEQELKNDVLDKLIEEIDAATGAKPVGLEDIMLSMDKLPLNKQFAFMAKLLDGLWQGVDIRGRKVGLKQLDKKMLDYYQHEDEIFRMATYIRRRAEGMKPAEAGISARDQFLNYDISAPWINAARATVLPFISYTYRAIPIVAKSLMQRPWKLAKYFTIAYGMNAIGYALSGGDEDKERKSLRKQVAGSTWIGAPRLIRMAWNDERNNPYYWDVRRLIPVGDVFDLNQYNAALPIIPASLMPAGPIAMGFEFLLNKTGFFGEEIVDPLADNAILGGYKVTDWLWKSYAPSAPWIPYSYYWDKMGVAVNGGRDRLGREYKILPALASSFGIKIAAHDVKYGMALKALDIERTVQAVRLRLTFLEKDLWQRKISKSLYEFRKKEYMNRLKTLEKEARELMAP